MYGEKKVGLVQDIIGLLLLTDNFKVEAQPSCHWMKYHVEQVK